ncbi:hypothetical protein [Paenibacillus tepidiphilus]|uniref:hypothetical protein n=1 Tax=Paenibacillus tepidiphilus TaxID=2608683 RepID=UPI00123ABD08|nr:hypothetical protein [Paenibacillus tepidiphilus]
MLIQLFHKSPVIMAMRHYRDKGPYFIIKISRNSGEIVSSYRIDELPKNWSDSFVQELLETADRYLVSNRKIN